MESSSPAISLFLLSTLIMNLGYLMFTIPVLRLSGRVHLSLDCQAAVERWHPAAELRTMSQFHGKGI